MKKGLLTFFVVVISVAVGCLTTLGVMAYFALDPNFKCKCHNFDEIEGDVTFKDFSVRQEMDSQTEAKFLYLKRKGACFGVIGTDANGVETVLLTDPKNRMTFLMSFSGSHINKFDLGYNCKPRIGAIFNTQASDWDWAWRYESNPNGGQIFFVDIDWDGLDDIKRVISSSGEETGQFIFYKKSWIPVNEYCESEDGQARAEDSENKYIFDHCCPR